MFLACSGFSWALVICHDVDKAGRSLTGLPHLGWNWVEVDCGTAGENESMLLLEDQNEKVAA